MKEPVTTFYPRDAGRVRRVFFTLWLTMTIAATSGAPLAAAQSCLRGVNLAGGEFGEAPGKYGHTYIYPSDDTLDYFAHKGMTVIRLPFKWERLQPELNGPLADDALERLTDAVNRISERGMTTILDPHNYARYFGKFIGTDDVPVAAFGDFWSRLATHFSGREDVIFLLMNEPAGVTAASWLEAANAGIAGIRGSGADALIMVPGTIWTGASHWFETQEGGSNADVLQSIRDPLDNFVFDIHQYMDEDFSGTHETCPRVADALLALEGVSGWFRQHGYRGFVGEFGGTNAPECLEGLAEMARYLNDRSDIWVGWAAWAAGEWWGDYPLSLQPEAGMDKPQMKVLAPMLPSPGHPSALCR